APMATPFTEPSKYATAGLVSRKNRPPPKTTRPTTASVSPPTTNAPMRGGLARLAMLRPSVRLAAGEEAPHLGVGGMFEQVSGIAGRDHRLRLGVEEHAVGGDREDAGQPMRKDHH